MKPIVESPSPPFPAGEWWIDEIGGLHSAGGVDRSFDALYYRHLGLVKVAVCPTKIVVQWDINKVSDDALAAVIERFSGCRLAVPVHLRFFYFGWTTEQYSNPEEIIERIGRIQQYRSVELIRSTYIEEHDLSDIKNGTKLVVDGYELWERTGGHFGKATQDELSGYIPHLLMFRPTPHDNELVFSYIGSKSTMARVCGPEWAASVHNMVSDESMPPMNRHYDYQVSAAYRDVFKTGEPRYDHVRALLHIDGSEPFWISYERLLTYSLIDDGEPAVVCDGLRSADAQPQAKRLGDGAAASRSHTSVVYDGPRSAEPTFLTSEPDPLSRNLQPTPPSPAPTLRIV